MNFLSCGKLYFFAFGENDINFYSICTFLGQVMNIYVFC